ncbi:MAG: hypothetical protein KAJ37_02190, partial [Candidatus Krumholzibacteria bacterium]|nr:hypothetical protein [Candidatus Krumholzibacteria bacterium]
SDKVYRVDYYQRTIAKARGSIRDDQTRDEAAEVVADEGAAGSDRVEAIGKRLSIPLTLIERVTGSPPVYRFHVAGSVCAIPAPFFVDQRKVQGQLFALCGRLPSTIKKDETPSWQTIVNAIGACAVDVDAGDDATEDGEVAALLRDYLNTWAPRAIPSGTAIENPDLPFIRNDSVWFRLEELMSHARNAHVRDTRRAFAQKLGMIGAVRETAKVWTRDDTESTRSFYRIPFDKLEGLRASTVDVDALIAEVFEESQEQPIRPEDA